VWSRTKICGSTSCNGREARRTAFAARDGEFLVGDGLDYRLAVYDADSRFPLEVW
jgi:hypothetical protein